MKHLLKNTLFITLLFFTAAPVVMQAAQMEDEQSSKRPAETSLKELNEARRTKRPRWQTEKKKAKKKGKIQLKDNIFFYELDGNPKFCLFMEKYFEGLTINFIFPSLKNLLKPIIEIDSTRKLSINQYAGEHFSFRDKHGSLFYGKKLEELISQTNHNLNKYKDRLAFQRDKKYGIPFEKEKLDKES